MATSPDVRPENEAFSKPGSSLRRVFDEAPYLCRCSDNKTAAYIKPRANAVNWPYMQVNRKNVVSWLVFDLDHANPMIWEDAALPPPNLIVRNPKTSSAHLYYAITPVLSGPGARQKPVDFMKAVYRSLAHKLRADLAYSGPVAKTPGHPWWETTELHNFEYSLGELQPASELEYAPPWRGVPDLETVSHSRHCTLFEQVRFFAYAIVRQEREQGSERSFIRRVEQYARSKNRFSGRHYKSSKLRQSQVRATVKSITRWTWSKYYGAADCARGTMLLDRAMPLPEKQRLAAKYTHKERVKKTEKKIRTAVTNLESQGIPLTQKAVAEASGLSRQTVAKHKHLLAPTGRNVVDFPTAKQRLNAGKSNVKNATYQIAASLLVPLLFDRGCSLVPARTIRMLSDSGSVSGNCESVRLDTS
ncbi:replication initiation protein [Marinobacter salsuginis]|nr:replication initiation protein [Marinobacter salsuginis]